MAQASFCFCSVLSNSDKRQTTATQQQPPSCLTSASKATRQRRRSSLVHCFCCSQFATTLQLQYHQHQRRTASGRCILFTIGRSIICAAAAISSSASATASARRRQRQRAHRKAAAVCSVLGSANFLQRQDSSQRYEAACFIQSSDLSSFSDNDSAVRVAAVAS